jgi:hypothetical protein
MQLSSADLSTIKIILGDKFVVDVKQFHSAEAIAIIWLDDQ